MLLARIFLTKQFLFFLLFGGLAACTNLCVGWLLYRQEQSLLPYPAAVLIGAASGLLVNFFLNYWFNFRFRDRSILSQFRTFVVVALIGTLLTVGIAWLCREAFLWAGIELIPVPGRPVSAKFAAHFLSVGIVTVYSFLGHKFFSFNHGLRKGVAALFNKNPL